MVTGAANGIGRAEAELLAQSGANVVFTDLDDANGASAAAVFGDKAIFVRHDVSSASDWQRVISATVARFARVGHLVLLATKPPGPLVRTGSPLYYQLAKRQDDFEHSVAILSTVSVAAAARSLRRTMERQADISPPIPFEWAGQQIGDGPRNPAFPAESVLGMLETTDVPVLHIGGDHDTVFPVENWYALSGSMPTLRLLTLPQAGHGPYLQYPEACAGRIAAFLK